MDKVNKYNIGDVVFFMLNNEIVRRDIVKIEISSRSTKDVINVTYNIREIRRDFCEDHFSDSLEDLLKKLSIKYMHSHKWPGL